METVEEKTPAPRAHDFARARRDFNVDGMDNVAEGRDETVEPLIQRVARIARLAGMLLIAALISTMEAAGRKSASSWAHFEWGVSPLAGDRQQRGEQRRDVHGVQLRTRDHLLQLVEPRSRRLAAYKTSRMPLTTELRGFLPTRKPRRFCRDWMVWIRTRGISRRIAPKPPFGSWFRAVFGRLNRSQPATGDLSVVRKRGRAKDRARGYQGKAIRERLRLQITL